jgi:cysteinyl-tRNA synthetase
MGRLHIQSPTEEPKATDHIQEMLDMISSLMEREKAYESGGDVFYSVSSFDGYGQLSGKNIEDLQAGARVDVNEKKRDALDFVLWKKVNLLNLTWIVPGAQGDLDGISNVLLWGGNILEIILTFMEAERTWFFPIMKMKSHSRAV